MLRKHLPTKKPDATLSDKGGGGEPERDFLPLVPIVLCKTHWIPLARDASLLAYPANFAVPTTLDLALKHRNHTQSTR
jgi:hypothetical protein